MKKILIIFFFILMTAIYITINNNLTKTINKDFEEYLSNANKLISFKEKSSGMTIYFLKNNKTITNFLNITTYVKNDKKVSIIDSLHRGVIPEHNIIAYTEEYSFQNKSVVCVNYTDITTNKTLFNWTCMEVKYPCYMNYRIEIKMLENLYNKNALIFESEKSNTISGISCKEIKIDINISKLDLEDKRFLFMFARYMQDPQRLGLIELIKTVYISFCIEPTKGIVLQKNISIVMDESRLEEDNFYKIETTTNVDSFIPNVEISDEIFKLPNETIQIVL